MTRTGEAARPTVEDHTETFVEWTRTHSRQLSFGALTLLTIGLMAYVVTRSSRTKEANANLALGRAEYALEQGQAAEAQTALEAIVQRYKGTPAGFQATLRLAQRLFEQGKFQEGVGRLETAAKDETSGPFATSLRQMAGAGYDAMGQPAEAAARYVDAAERTTLKGEREGLLAQAARAYGRAGNKAEAVRLWREIASNPMSPGINEARIRLGELTAEPARGG